MVLDPPRCFRSNVWCTCRGTEDVSPYLVKEDPPAVCQEAASTRAGDEEGFHQARAIGCNAVPAGDDTTAPR
ncbi:unnamed protein product [Gadus morhua 'NCC']